MSIMKHKPLDNGDASKEELSLKSLKRPDVSDELKMLEEAKERRRQEQDERERERRERERRYNCCGCGC